ncbi:DUF1648 domain-containing protein, partial [Streptomyces bambusae]|nr:DUF1648 domain-containing protein [Streptomyces bambusae]
MSPTERGRGLPRAAAAWAAGVLAGLVALPVAASGRLPDRLATHWGGSGTPDSAMPLGAVVAFPALVWSVVLVVVALSVRWTGGRVPATATLLSVGVGLLGAQASIVRANLDRSDWHDAGGVGLGVVLTLAAAVAAAALGGHLVRGRR